MSPIIRRIRSCMKNTSNSDPHFFGTSAKLPTNLALGLLAFSLFPGILFAEPADNEGAQTTPSRTAATTLRTNARAEGPPYPGYLRLEAGVQRQQDLVLENSDGARISFDPGFRLDISGGSYVNNYLAVELACGLMHNSAKSLLDVPLNSGAENLDHYQVPLMANVICRVPVAGPLSLQGGVGLGAVYSVFWGGNIFNSADDWTGAG